MPNSADDLKTTARILVLDDDPPTASYIDRMLRRAGYAQVTTLTTPLAALDVFLRTRPDLLILDLHMPEMDGFAVMQQLAPHLPEDGFFPTLMLTGDTTVELKRRALALGATDFLTKPFDAFEALLRIGGLLRTRMLHRSLLEHAERLETRVRERTRELEGAELELVERLALVAEHSEPAARAHIRAVGALAERLALELGSEAHEARLIGRAALLHDVGKTAVPDSIWLNPGDLTAAEREEMQRHPTIGATILAGSRFALLRLAEDVARSHHERWDGAGYPSGLTGESIPLPGRIVAVADAFDALQRERPYKPAWPAERVVAEIRSQRGRQFDPAVVDALLHLLEEESAGGTPGDVASQTGAGISWQIGAR